MLSKVFVIKKVHINMGPILSGYGVMSFNPYPANVENMVSS